MPNHFCKRFRFPDGEVVESPARLAERLGGVKRLAFDPGYIWSGDDLPDCLCGLDRVETFGRAGFDNIPAEDAAEGDWLFDVVPLDGPVIASQMFLDYVSGHASFGSLGF